MKKQELDAALFKSLTNLHYKEFAAPVCPIRFLVQGAV